MKTIFMVLALSCASFYPAFANQTTLPIVHGSKTQSTAGKINLNTADIKTITGSFKGIGQKRAQAIINYRNAHQGFKSVAELGDVRGIGKAYIKKNLAQLETVFRVNE